MGRQARIEADDDRIKEELGAKERLARTGLGAAKECLKLVVSEVSGFPVSVQSQIRCLPRDKWISHEELPANCPIDAGQLTPRRPPSAW